MIKLYEHQKLALENMHNGCVLCGGVGSGKSLTSLAYYYILNGGDKNSLYGGAFRPLARNAQSLYIITTARKRDTFEWEKELLPFRLTTDPKTSYNGIRIVVDSWNNIEKYVGVTGAFFIFDEQRVVGYGKWSRSFIKITKTNNWILLSATPGDTWMDYIPVFIANGFYKNKTQFTTEHVRWKPRSKFPQVDEYINTRKLERLRSRILIEMDFDRPTIRHNIDVFCPYDIQLYKHVMKDRKNPYMLYQSQETPLQNASDLCLTLRRVINSDDSRIWEILQICKEKKKVIIFYNFDYELDILLNANWASGTDVAQWNGHKHQPLPKSDKWVYLVQYTAGAEGWNCTDTDTIIFYSQTYSYKTLEQARGRIDRLNTKFVDLYYYHLKSKAPIDIAISRAIRNKKKFNEGNFVSSF